MSDESKVFDVIWQYEPLINRCVANTCRRLGISRNDPRRDDVVQSWRLAAVIAAKKYDASRGAFSTYLVQYYTHDALRMSGVVYDALRLSPKKRREVVRVENILETHPSLSDGEIALHAKVEPSLVAEVRSGLRTGGVLSLDAKISDNYDEATLVDMVPSTDEHVDEQLYREQLLDKVQDLVKSKLSDRERQIIVAMFYREEPATLVELSQEIGVTSERIRQIKLKALEKLKRAARSA